MLQDTADRLYCHYQEDTVVESKQDLPKQLIGCWSITRLRFGDYYVMCFPWFLPYAFHNWPCLSGYSEYDQIYLSDHLWSENSLLQHFKLWVSSTLTCHRRQHAFRPPWQSDHLTNLTSFCLSQKWSNYQGSTVCADCDKLVQTLDTF